MKHIIFVWIPIVLFALLLGVAGYTSYPVPFHGAIFLLGSSISGYTGIKSIAVYQTAKELPTGLGYSQDTKDKMIKILIALYVLTIEALVIQYIKPSLELPLDDLFTMSGICTGIILGGSQAMKRGEVANGSFN